MKMKNLFTTLVIATVVLFTGCIDDDFIEVPGTCPVVSSTSPANLAINVPLNKIITVTFNEEMDATTITSASFVVSGSIVPGTITYSGKTATFTPTDPLIPNHTYTGRITTAIKDLTGNAIQTDYIWTFSTGATIAPIIVSTDPLSDEIGVVLNKVITATFNVPMDPTTLESPATTFTLKQGLIVVPGTVVYLGTTASFTPTSALTTNTVYTATITTAATDVTATALANDTTWSFTTGVLVAPVVDLTSPLDNDINVALNKVITATFDVPMNATTLESPATTFTLKNGLIPVAGTVTYLGNTASFAPSVNLLSGTVYTATISTGAQNVAGTGLANPYVWSFTTVVVIAPTVTSTDPLNTDINVALNKTITADFSEAMNGITIASPATTFTLNNGLIPVGGTVTYLGTTASFNPTVDLLPGTVYTATISTGAQNIAGTGLDTDKVWSFTTIAAIPPTVTSTDPLNTDINVALNKTITADFSEAMNGTTIASPATTFKVELGGVPIAGTVSYLGTTASFNPTANLLSGETYTATITTAAQNLAGTGLASDKVWSFTTVDPLGPIAPDLNSVARFGIISGVGISNNAGPSEIHNLDIGIYPGARTSITGFFDVDGGPGLIFGGDFYASDDIAPPGVAAMLLQAKNDLVSAYNDAMGATLPAPQVAPADLGGQTLAPGIYTSATTMLLQGGNLTLDAQGDANAVWIFKVGTAFTSIGTAPYPSPSGGNVILAGDAQAKNVYWVVGSSATIGDYTSFYGTIMAFSSITMNTGATATGRMLARNAAVTLTSTNIINKP